MIDIGEAFDIVDKSLVLYHEVIHTCTVIAHLRSINAKLPTIHHQWMIWAEVININLYNINLYNSPLLHKDFSKQGHNIMTLNAISGQYQNMTQNTVKITFITYQSIYSISITNLSWSKMSLQALYHKYSQVKKHWHTCHGSFECHRIITMFRECSYGKTLQNWEIKS